MVAGDGDASAGTNAAAPASRRPGPRPAGTRIDAGTLSAAAEVNRHHAQRLEAHQRASMHAPQKVRDDEPGECA